MFLMTEKVCVEKGACTEVQVEGCVDRSTRTKSCVGKRVREQKGVLAGRCKDRTRTKRLITPDGRCRSGG